MKEIPLSGKRGQGLVALVDDEDFDKLNGYSWRPNKEFYVHRTTHRKIKGRRTWLSFAMHRVVMNAPKGMDVDHRDGDPLNNQKCNLRLATRMQNSANQRVKTFPKLSRFKGVSFRKRHIIMGWSNPWVAYIKKNYRFIHIGNFASEIEAARAYNEAAQRLFGEFACLNSV